MYSFNKASDLFSVLQSVIHTGPGLIVQLRRLEGSYMAPSLHLLHYSRLESQCDNRVYEAAPKAGVEVMGCTAERRRPCLI